MQPTDRKEEENVHFHIISKNKSDNMKLLTVNGLTHRLSAHSKNNFLSTIFHLFSSAPCIMLNK